MSHGAIGLILFFIIYDVRALKMRRIWAFLGENIRGNLTKSLSDLELRATSYYRLSVCPVGHDSRGFCLFVRLFVSKSQSVCQSVCFLIRHAIS